MIPESARNIDFVGHTDCNGHGDCVQVMVARGHAWLGTRTSRGINVVDVRDPRQPRAVNFVPIHKNSWCLHLQAAEDLLLCIEELDLKAVMSMKEYYGGSPDRVDGRRYGTRGTDFSAGMRVYDVSDPANPRAIGFLEVEGLGLHRIWWTGGRYAYASALLDGFTDHILLIIDLADPTKPREAGRWWIPGMFADGGERKAWTHRVALHHAVVADDIAYGSWRDGGLTILDVSDKSAPKLIAHRNWCPPFGGGTHSALPLHDRGLCVVADEATQNIDQEQMKRIWMMDIRERSNPVSIATFPVPAEQDYVAKGGQFGPHNLHENRPESFHSSSMIFATYQSAGVRVYDISDPFRPEEIGHFVPPMPVTWMEPLRGRARMRHTADIFVSADGLIYASDYDAGLYILQWRG
ncbi:MAG: LVIVD repeat-containing protein [Acetobacteraceae bacterium]